ncbi:hypothetical protein ILUMI_19834 [Ignelater luminosus]|uniref:Uncharacterized protein n=1 Tax=Ignelater luminosus TaxID=2038154 RepID=A0A8K0CKW3_IGNLU|nr:hypothetical protein ILUMI_19834 [Ignelater luminosus]
MFEDFPKIDPFEPDVQHPTQIAADGIPRIITDYRCHDIEANSLSSEKYEERQGCPLKIIRRADVERSKANYEKVERALLGAVERRGKERCGKTGGTGRGH